MGYYDIYKKRLNRYGTDYKTRMQNQREKEFEDYLVKSVYRIDFDYNSETIPGTLEPYKQDATQTLNYLLTRVKNTIPAGTVLQLPDKDGVLQAWMVWWLEDYEASGYNRYVVLRMATILSDGTYCYLKGPNTNPIRDTAESSPAKVLYEENENLYLLVTPYDPKWQRGYYFTISQQGETLAFVVRGVDIVSVPGISYVSIDPEYIHADTTEDTETTKSAQTYWYEGGQ